MARYTLEQRSNILAQQLENENVRDFSLRVGVSDASIYNWKKQMNREKGGFKPLEISSASKSTHLNASMLSCSSESRCFITIMVDNIEITIHEYVKADYVSSLLGW